MTNLLLAIIIALSFNNNVYAQTDTATLEEVQLTDVQIVQNKILEDKDFVEYLANFGVSENELKDVLNSEYLANYVEFEFAQSPTQDDVIASWDILEWHIQKIKNFISYIFTGVKDNLNSQYNGHNNMHHHHHHNGYNYPNYPYNNFNGNLYNNNNPNGNNMQNGANFNTNNNRCNCNCDNCINCLNKN